MKAFSIELDYKKNLIKMLHLKHLGFNQILPNARLPILERVKKPDSGD